MNPDISLIGAPEKILAAVGFLPFSMCFGNALIPCRSKILDQGLLCMAVVFVLGGALRGSIDISRLISDAIAEPTTEHMSPVLHAMSEVADGIFPLQPVIVLSILLYKRSSWWDSVQVPLRGIVGLGNLWLKRQTSWKRTGTTLSCVTLMLTVLWECAEWRAFLDQNPEYYTTNFDNAFAPLPIRITTIQDMTIWVMFCSLPHHFTLQVYTCIIVNAIILRDACNEFLVKISEIRSGHYGKNATCAIRELQEFHLKLVLCMRKGTDVYSWILFVIFTSNLALACSFVTAVIVVPSSFLTGSISYYISVLLFFSYSVVFAIPLVQVYEKAGKFALKLCELRLEMESSTSADVVAEHGLTTVQSILALEESAQNFVPCFTGGRILWYSRSLLTAACTFVVSTGFLVQEIVNNYTRTTSASHSEPDLHPCCSYNGSQSSHQSPEIPL